MLRDELAIDARRCGLTVVHWPEGMPQAAWNILMLFSHHDMHAECG